MFFLINCKLSISERVSLSHLPFIYLVLVKRYLWLIVFVKSNSCTSQVNVANLGFDALEVQLKQEELIIKDEPEEVIENTSSLEIIQFDTIPVTPGIRDRIANTQIKVLN